jgi:hypothetical protein
MSIILTSGSEGATKESLERVLVRHGYKPEEEPTAEAPPEEKPAPTPEQVEWQRHAANYLDATEEFRSEHPDWEKSVSSGVPITAAVYGEIIKHAAPAVTYFLSKNLGVLDSLNRMQPQQVAAEVARLAATLKAIPTGRPTLRMRSGSTRDARANVPVDVPRHEEESEQTSREAALRGDFKAFRAAERAKGRGGLSRYA